ncbi:GNAT family N-acetyltransferase [Thalassomonas actiniarum]|uniref:GNAT family N-acetyltransferase n=1 Tax=Thalassomonas actiniarum TaxID=485447 RepID=A0AAE9YRV5_9GAMM|nr:GNAT family N-acetyltransferase [Thalassomonas actiniarum]WDD99298.1 GNAT family N-acetyltransferase [Thalassomonas actiniarum]
MIQVQRSVISHRGFTAFDIQAIEIKIKIKTFGGFVQINETTRSDFEAFWPVFKEVVQAQETYAFDPDIEFESAYNLWCLSPEKSYVIKEKGLILGSYYIKPNASGPGKHISNCGYMVAAKSRGKGVARKLCLHSQQVAIELGYTAMQFNSVVSSNEVAVQLWKKLGYKIIGTIPNAYKHRRLGFVDSFIMHKQLT